MPRRVLLLAREVGEWWERTLPERAYDRPGAADALASRTTVGRLGPVEPTADGRERAFLDAVAAFAPHLGTAPSAPVPDLSPEVYDHVLFVHLAALTALTAPERAPAPAALRDDLLDAALVREAAYWHNTAAEAGLEFRDRHALDGAVAAATLMTADSLEEARGVLGRVPGLEAPPGLMATWLRSLYPPAEDAAWFHPLRPDVLAERHLARVLEADAGLPAAVLADATPRQARQALGVLTETGRMYGPAEDALRRALERNLAGLWESAVEVAQETGGALGGLLAEALERSDDGELATTIAHGLPEESVALSELAVVATSAARDVCRARPPGLVRDEELAVLSDRLARYLARLSRRDEALAAAREAVDVSRRVAKATKNSRSPQLARALTTLSQRWAASGDARKGLAASEESVAIYSRMPEPAREEVLHDYASALAMLLVRRSETARVVKRVTAVTAGRDAVTAFERLRELPGDPYALERGQALNIYAVALAQAGHPGHALNAVEAAVAVFRQVAETRPDSALPLLSMALGDASIHRRQFGDGIEAAEEALAIRRALAAERPEAFAPQLAGALGTVASAYADNGRLREAVVAAEDGVAIWRPLYEANSVAYHKHLSEALVGLSICALAVGRLDAGLAAGEEAVMIDAERERGTEGARMAMAMNFVARKLNHAGQAEAAYACADHAVTVYGRLAKRQPRFAKHLVAARMIRRSARRRGGAQPTSAG